MLSGVQRSDVDAEESERQGLTGHLREEQVQ
jgi:hypothetical protein